MNPTELRIAKAALEILKANQPHPVLTENSWEVLYPPKITIEYSSVIVSATISFPAFDGIGIGTAKLQVRASSEKDLDFVAIAQTIANEILRRDANRDLIQDYVEGVRAVLMPIFDKPKMPGIVDVRLTSHTPQKPDESYLNSQCKIVLKTFDNLLLERDVAIHLARAHLGISIDTLPPGVREFISRYKKREAIIAKLPVGKPRQRVDCVFAKIISRLPPADIAELLDMTAKAAIQHGPLYQYASQHIIRDFCPEIKHIEFRDGILFSRVRLGSNALWRNGRLTVRKTSISEQMRYALVGRKLTDVISHDLLDDTLIIKKMSETPSGSINIDVADHLKPIAAAGAPSWRARSF